MYTQTERKADTFMESKMSIPEFLASSVTLDKIPIGSGGIITSVGGEKALRHRLLDMGLTPKTHIFVKKAAPMGDPIEFVLRGYELTLRKEDAALITVKPDEAEKEA